MKLDWPRIMSVASLAALITTSCSNLPGSKENQGAVIGGVSGAAVGAAVGGPENRVLGAVLGGAIGAGSGYVIGANMDKIKDRDRESAEVAARKAETTPATPEDVDNSTTADLNQDGFVTLDEVVAMEKAGLTDEEIFNRLQATNQIFELNAEQRQYLRDQGVSEQIIQDMLNINREQRDELLRQQSSADRNFIADR